MPINLRSPLRFSCRVHSKPVQSAPFALCTISRDNITEKGRTKCNNILACVLLIYYSINPRFGWQNSCGASPPKERAQAHSSLFPPISLNCQRIWSPLLPAHLYTRDGLTLLIRRDLDASWCVMNILNH